MIIGAMITMHLASQYSYAQSTTKQSQDNSTSLSSAPLSAAELALKIGQKIESQSLFIDNLQQDNALSKDPFSVDTSFSLALVNLQNSFFRLNNTNFAELFTEYERAALQSESPNKIASANLFRGLVRYSNSPDLDTSFPEIEKFLEAQTNNSDWIVSAISWHLLSYLNARRGDLNSALEAANNALSEMPEEISEINNQMKILLIENLAHLNARLRNPLLTAKSIDSVITLQIQAGQPVDGKMHINNLIYVFSHWRDHETTQALAKILFRNEGFSKSDTPGLTHMRLAQTMSEQNNFQETLAISNKGLAIVQNETIKTGLTALRIAGLAGVGQVEDAKLELKEFRAQFKEKKPLSDTISSYLIYADALIAFGEGDIPLGQKLMTKRMDKYIQSTLKLSNKSTTELIATLENSKSRQMERQSALRREADLREAELKQKTFTNYLLIVLSGILGIAALLSALFARYRSRSAARLRIARDQAKAGEKAKTEFLAIMSHELRTPLNGIIGIADLLSTTAPTESLRKKNNIILESGNDLLSLVEGILDMSRIEAGEMSLDYDFVNIRHILETLDQLWRPSISKKNIVFTTFVDDSVPDLFKTDEVRLRQCVNNLVSNACKFTTAGRIHIHVTATPADVRGEMILSLIVADTGSGIRAEVMERLFKPFVQADASITRSHGGAGLGLAITRSLARMLGGNVNVVSREGRGSEFTLTFQGEYSQIEKDALAANNPSLEQNPIDTLSSEVADDNIMSLIPVVPKAALPVEEALFSGLRILIVEDVISNQDIIQIFLRPMGCQFVTANNGIEALRALEIYDLDLVLMDIRMPEMDGIEATRRIRAHEKAFHNIPIIALTADKTEETQHLCQAAGVDLFLTKPIISKDLISAVRFVIEHPPRDKMDQSLGQQQSNAYPR